MKGVFIMTKKIMSVFIAFTVILSIQFAVPEKAFAATTKTQAQAVEWAKSLIGTEARDMDGMYGAQCVDFIQHYYSWLGVSGGGGNARDYAWNTLPSGFTRIEDYYGFVPNPGDIAVWTVGSGGVWAGHVGVVISANLSTLTVADVYGSVNETPYRKVHQTTYYYNGGGMQFWGVIRPNFASSSSSSSTPTQTFDTVANGTYFLYNRSTNLALNLGWNNDANCENVHAYTYDTTNRGELMSITSCSTDGKTYKIRPIDAKRLVQMYGESPYNGVNVCIYDDLANSTQWWKFKKVGNGYAILIDCNTNYALSSVSGDAVLNTYTGAGNQIWELIPYSPTYTVNYNANGGSGSMASATFSVGKDTNLAANTFTRAGYTFQGWSKSASATTATYSDKALVADLAGGASSVTLYAIWKANPVSTYTIVYDGNGNTSGYMNSEKVTYNTSVNLQKNGFKRFGWRFKGWSTDKNSTTAQYTDGQSVKNLAQSGTVTLYAVWEHIEVPQLTGLKASKITKDSVTLTWDRFDVDGYEVWQDDVYRFKVTENSVTIANLAPATTYFFSIQPYIEGASYSIGQGVTVNTLSGLEAITGAAGSLLGSNPAKPESTQNVYEETVPSYPEYEAAADDHFYPEYEAAADDPDVFYPTPDESTSTPSVDFSDQPSVTEPANTSSGSENVSQNKPGVPSADSNTSSTSTGTGGTTSSNTSASGTTSGSASSSETTSGNTSVSGTTSNSASTGGTTPDSTSADSTTSDNINNSATSSSTSASGTASGSADTGDTTTGSTGTGNTTSGDVNTGTTSGSTNTNTDNNSSANNAAQTAGLGAAISSSICAILYFIKKLFGK